MALPTPAEIGSDTHVDAYVATGTSPGRSGTTRVRIETDFGPAGEHDVGWEVHGPAHGPSIVVLGGISAGRHLRPTGLDPSPGWWPEVVGEGRALDPRRHRLIGIDYLGPDDSAPGSHPVTTGDQARALAAVLDVLGAQRVAVVGASYGGMVALALCALFPDLVRRMVIFCAAHRTHPMATALRSVQRRTVRLGLEVHRVREASALARGLAMATYRSADEFEGRFERGPGLENGWARFPVEDYLEARGEAFAGRFPAERFLRLSESVDLHAVRPAEITTPSTLVSFDTDTLVPPRLVAELADGARGPCSHIEVQTQFGHDAFLKEHETVREIVRSGLGESEAGR